MHQLSSVLFIFLAIICTTETQAQEKKYFSIELAGSGGFGSINYEHPVLKRWENSDFRMRYGFSFAPIDQNNGTNLIFPFMFSHLLFDGPHKVEASIGQAISITTKGNFFLTGLAAMGYRYEPADRNYFLRLSYTPLISYLVNNQWQHWAGFTYGYSFNRK